MGSGSLLKILSLTAFVSLQSATSPNIIRVICPEIPVPSYYVNGRGREFVDCVNKNYAHEAERLRREMGVTDTTLPRYKFSVLPGRELGIYVNNADEITFDTSKVNSRERVLCMTVLDHELRHSMDKRRSKEIRKNSWMKFSTHLKRRFTLQDFSTQIISEALAVQEQDTSDLSGIVQGSWPKNREEFYCSDPRLLGRYLVGNLVHDFGHRAEDVIIQNIPTQQEILHPEEWQKRIRKIIERAK